MAALPDNLGKSNHCQEGLKILKKASFILFAYTPKENLS